MRARDSLAMRLLKALDRAFCALVGMCVRLAMLPCVACSQCAGCPLSRHSNLFGYCLAVSRLQAYALDTGTASVEIVTPSSSRGWLATVESESTQRYGTAVLHAYVRLYGAVLQAGGAAPVRAKRRSASGAPPGTKLPLRPYILISHCNVLPLTPPDPAGSWVGVPLTQCASETGDHCGRLAIPIYYRYVQYSTVQYGTVRYGTVRYGTVR